MWKSTKERLEEDYKTSAVRELKHKFGELEKLSKVLKYLDNDGVAGIQRVINFNTQTLSHVQDSTAFKLSDSSYRKTFNVYASKRKNMVDFVSFANHGDNIVSALKSAKDVEDNLNKIRTNQFDKTKAYQEVYRRLKQQPLR